MRKSLFLLPVCICSLVSNAQNVGIGTPNPQNKLHVAGGFRLDTLTGVNGAGLLRHDANGVVYGIKFSGNTNDVLRGDGTFGTYNINGSIGWLLNGNSGTNPALNFLGTIDNQPIVFKVNNIRHGYLGNSIFWGSNAGEANTGNSNIGIGSGALGKNTTKGRLIAIGDSALYNNLGNIFPAVAATNNIAIGYKALYANINGDGNVAIGANTLEFNRGSSNTAIGVQTLRTNIDGFDNSAVGSFALSQNTNGDWNSAFGANALSFNTTGNFNSAFGPFALQQNNGNGNTAAGFDALRSNTASENSAFGYSALVRNTGGTNNNAFGAFALENNAIGWYNNAFGKEALRNSTTYWNSAFGNFALRSTTSGYGNTAVGNEALARNVTGALNTAIGDIAGYFLPTNVSNVTVIGQGTGWNTTSSNQVNIGNFSVSWIGGQTGWFHYSDKRIKNDIKDDVPGLSFITRLKPITYHVDVREQEEIANTGKIETSSELIKPAKKDWEGKYDVEKIKMTGFLAQDVEEAAKAINYSFSGVHNPKNGGLYSLDYSAFVVPLVKAVQEQQTIIDKQQRQIDDLLKRMEALEKK